LWDVFTSDLHGDVGEGLRGKEVMDRRLESRSD
jgi:hypothetical protein